MQSVSRLIAGLLVVCALLGGAGVFAVAAAEPNDHLEVARKAIDEGRHAEAITLLRARLQAEAITLLRERLQAEGGNTEDAHDRYLLGLALFRQTDAELSGLREQKLQRIDVLQPEQVEQLRECLALLNKAVALAPDALFAPDAAYLAARVQEWGYLKRYDAALMAYKEVVERYPGTEGARKAAERIEYWNNLFKHGGIMPEGMAPLH